MPAKRGDRAAPPPRPGEWDVILGTSEAAKGWADLCQQVPSNTFEAWTVMRAGPPASSNSRHHALKGSLSTGTYQGVEMTQWQIEVTGSGRIWYLADHQNRRSIVMYASTRHPKATE